MAHKHKPSPLLYEQQNHLLLQSPHFSLGFRKSLPLLFSHLSYWYSHLTPQEASSFHFFFLSEEMENREAWRFTRTELLHSQQLALKLAKYLEHVFFFACQFSHTTDFLDCAQLISSSASLCISSMDLIPCLNQYTFF